MVVLHDFTPCVDDELEVKRGQVIVIIIINFYHHHLGLNVLSMNYCC